MAKLNFILHDGQEIVVTVAETTTIGRGDGNDVVVDDPRISANHAVIRRNGAGLFELQDLGSKAGTLCNGTKVDKHLLADGDKLSFGPLQGRFALEPGDVAFPVRSKAGKKRGKAAKTPAASAAPSRKSPPDDRAAARAAAAKIVKESMAEADKLKKQITSQKKELHDITEELQVKLQRLSRVPEDEKKLEVLTLDLVAGRKRQTVLTGDLAALDQEFEQKQNLSGSLQAEVSRLKQEVGNLEQQRSEAYRDVESLRQEYAVLQNTLTEKTEHLAVTQEKTATLLALVEARHDQTKALERALMVLEQQCASSEAKLTELLVTEEKLLLANSRLIETESRHSLLNADLLVLAARKTAMEAGQQEATTRVAALSREQEMIESRLAASAASLAEGEQTLAEFLSQSAAQRTERETLATSLKAELVGLEELLGQKQEQVTAASAQLAELQAQRLELECQCDELKDTGHKLETAKKELQQTEMERGTMQEVLGTLEGQKTALASAVEALLHEHEEAESKLAVLRGHEHDLRGELASLSERERQQRERFEEISGLSIDAEKEHKGLKERLARDIDLTRRELADLELKLTPLRQWKEDMDKRYDRLATMPEDSTEARLLWKEIEAEKAHLTSLITKRDGDTRSITLSAAVLRGLSPTEPDATTESAENTATKPQDAGRLHAPEGFQAGSTPGERGNVGLTGTGALLSGTGQEMALKARVTRLRESVHREATRLEFLRQERAREETRTKGGGGGESMLREHERQLEGKVRREEEHLATVQRKLELAEMEEEKRREKIAELERKLSEIKSDIADAERDRTDARHLADISQVEMRAQEESLERARRGSQPDSTAQDKLAPAGGVLAAIINSSKPRPQLNLKPLVTPKES